MYRDDILLTVKNQSRVLIERTTKAIRKFFGREGLRITVDLNHKTVNFLDVTLEMNTGDYAPYHKDNENLKYINKKSNHPKAVVKSIVKSISNRISKLSANEGIFKRNENYYNEALTRAGYEERIEYQGKIDVSKKIIGREDKIYPNARTGKVQHDKECNKGDRKDKIEQTGDYTRKNKRIRRVVWFNYSQTHSYWRETISLWYLWKIICSNNYLKSIMHLKCYTIFLDFLCKHESYT